MKKIFFSFIIMILTFTANINFAGNPKSFQDNKISQTSSVVYICNSSTSYAFHSYVCHELKRCTHSISKVSRYGVQYNGYKACEICCN